MKGNAILGQSGGPTSVINSSLCGLIQGCQKVAEIENIYGMRYGIEGFMNDEIIDLGQESEDTITGLRKTPASALGSCRYKVQDSDFPLILEKFKAYNIRYYFLIGGNDTMDTINRIEKYCRAQGYELNGVGVPKTVDNDLFGTDHTPGYGSAARYIALSVQQSGRLARDMQRVDKYVIHQTVGRDAGWLAAASAITKEKPEDAPHLIYIPEAKLNKEKVIRDVKNCIEKYGWVSIVCGEGILWDDGTPVSASATTDKFSNIEFGAMGGSSAAMNLHKLISTETEYRGEFQVCESLPMCAIDRAVDVDLQEAYQCGLKAVEFATQKQSGVMVCINRISNDPYQCKLEAVALEDVAVKAKPMPPEYINKEGNGVTEAFIEYLKPIIGEFPKYVSFSNISVK
jgi:ATP-dependent phosphofructokinase / diphosphate-dependent phosphofructokinase